MSDHNRGAYTPQSEAPLAFDARRTRGGGERPFPMALLISAAILIAIVVALVVFLMRQPDGSESLSDAPVIDAMKTPPPEAAVPIAAPPPGMQVVTEDPNLVTPAFTPPPEQPAPRPTAPVAAAPVAAAPVAARPRAPITPLDPVGQLTIAPKAPAAPKAATSNAPKGTPGPVAPAVAAQVQIGAFSSPALAEKGWNDIAGMFPGQMAGKTKRVETVDTGEATLHRAFIGGFASRADADAFCQAMKGRGRQCLVR